MEEEKKGSELNIIKGHQESGEKALNVLVMGTSGSGKSSLINYLAGATLAEVTKSGISCTTETMFYDVPLFDKNSGFSTPRASMTQPQALPKGTGMWPQRLSST